jgi:hypothetical protein
MYVCGIEVYKNHKHQNLGAQQLEMLLILLYDTLTYSSLRPCNATQFTNVVVKRVHRFRENMP